MLQCSNTFKCCANALGLFRFPYIQLSFVATATHALSGGTGIPVGNRIDCYTGKEVILSTFWKGKHAVLFL